MHLHALQVENFRGVRKARLTFDDTTLLIGENDCGKSSLLEALALVLGSPGGDPPVFAAEHIHQRPDGGAAGPVRIGLDFSEREIGEWSEPEVGSLASLLGGTSRRTRRLELRVTATVVENGTFDVHWDIDLSGGGRRRSEDDAEHLEAVRRLNPILWIKGGALAGADIGATEGSPTKAKILGELEASFRAVISGRDEDRQLEAGFRTAREILAKRRLGGQGIGTFRPIIAEIVGTRGVGIRKRHERRFHGSAARKLGTLILTAALLRSTPSEGVGGGDPLLIVEDPEAHLHPMTLATVWRLLEEIPAQKIVTTQSGALLTGAQLHDVSRLTRTDGIVRQFQVRENALSREELRKVSYHLRMKRSAATFARCWLLVEGETEFWMLPELARICGYDFNLEGVACIEFAQCGLPPLIKVANELGIEWHVLTDGDDAGMDYAAIAGNLAKKGQHAKRVTALEERDLEHCFWTHGFAGVFQRAAGKREAAARRMSASRVIGHAIRRRSKPALAFDLILAAAEESTPEVPMPLRRVIETCVRLARGGSGTPSSERSLRPKRRG